MSEPQVFVGIDVSKAQLDVALRPTDCMRKLLTILNARLKHQTPWQENYANHA